MGNSVLTNPEIKSNRSDRDSQARSMRRNFDLIRNSNYSEIPRNPRASTRTLGAPLTEVEGSVWSSLGSNVRDALFPRKLPPLQLASRPVAAVEDPMRPKRSPASSAFSIFLHVAAIVAIVWFAAHLTSPAPTPKKAVVTPVLIRPYIPVTAPKPKAMGGGGGGGAHKIIQANKGRVPPVAKQQLAPLLAVDHPKLAVAPKVVMPKQVKMQVNPALPNLGMVNSPQVQMASNGTGSGAGFGAGSGGGIGSGGGSGMQVGNGGGYGGGVMTVGNGVSAPRLIHKVQPQFTAAARQNRLQGVVSIQLIVDAQGNPADIRVVHRLGMGLDEKAVEAVRQYKFIPATFKGHPVPVRMMIDVTFHLY